MTDSTALRTHMVDGQLRVNEVNNERIIDAIMDIPRETFVPKAARGHAYIDTDIMVAEGRTLMEPRVFARLVDAAAPAGDDLVLDIGCGSGYSSAVLARLADAVVAVESSADLVALAEKNLSGLEIMNVAVVEGNLTEGEAAQGPYDIIFIGGAIEEVPEGLVAQLKDGGRLVCVLIQSGVGRVHLVERQGDLSVSRNLSDANVGQLPEFRTDEGFVFA